VVRILRLRSFPVVAVICRMNRGEEYRGREKELSRRMSFQRMSFQWMSSRSGVGGRGREGKMEGVSMKKVNVRRLMYLFEKSIME